MSCLSFCLDMNDDIIEDFRIGMYKDYTDLIKELIRTRGLIK